MKEKLCNAIANLMKVKSLVTICLTVTFCVLTVQGNLPDNFMTAYSMVITFYFASQTGKAADDGNP